MTDVSLAVAFAAGVLSFLSPCVLALLPVYLAFLGNATAVAVPDGPVPAAADAPDRGAVLAQAVLFVIGFSAVFILLGTSLGLVGAPLLGIPALRQVAGIAVIVVGILTTGIFGPVLDRLRIGIDPAALPTTRGARAIGLGALVAIGWTPCIGPVLGAILTMGASSGAAPVVALLLTAYSLGLAVPFLVAAVAFPRIRPLVGFLRRHHVAVQAVTGLLIIGIGVLIYLNAFARLATMFTFIL
ncbi:MAG TPA: cytochrome c biogenesis protein CcdA [Candidatus Limnocylindria bacterium]